MPELSGNPKDLRTLRIASGYVFVAGGLLLAASVIPSLSWAGDDFAESTARLVGTAAGAAAQAWPSFLVLIAAAMIRCRASRWAAAAMIACGVYTLGVGVYLGASLAISAPPSAYLWGLAIFMAAIGATYGAAGWTSFRAAARVRSAS